VEGATLLQREKTAERTISAANTVTLVQGDKTKQAVLKTINRSETWPDSNSSQTKA